MENRQRNYKKNREHKDKKPSSVNLMDNRIIYLSGEINDEAVKDIIEKLLKLDISDHKKDITMFINSGGGAVTSALALFDVMNYIKSDVKTIGIGKCCSAASLISLNGTKGKRYLTKNSEVMIHEVNSGTFGKITQMQEDLEHSKMVNDRLLRIISDKTNLPLNQLKVSTINKDNWMNAGEALNYGFVDKVL